MTLTFKDLFEELQSQNLATQVKNSDLAEENIASISYNSKEVIPNTLFICKGNHFKLDYLLEALESGALGYISEVDYQLEGIPVILVKDIRQTIPAAASIFFNRPQDKLKIIAVGGTKGKTTTASFLRQVLDEHLFALGKKPTAFISTNTTFNGLDEVISENTTPEAIELYSIMDTAVKNGLEYLIIESSSQAFKNHRLDGLIFEASVLLNISPDHISPLEHKNFEDYFFSKLKMVNQSKMTFLNRDTDHYPQIKKEVGQQAYKTFSLTKRDADVLAENIKVEKRSSSFTVADLYPGISFELNMPGDFNISNALAAIAVAHHLNIPGLLVQKALKEAEISGRMDFYTSDDDQLILIADYAHNQLSFEAFYSYIQKHYPGYKLISIFGSPGGKALNRRKALAETGAEHSDLVILTEVDPNYEDPQSIIDEMLPYTQGKGCQVLSIPSREKAIQEAFNYADGKTIIAMLGKGSDTTSRVKGRLEAYETDMVIAKRELAKIKASD